MPFEDLQSGPFSPEQLLPTERELYGPPMEPPGWEESFRASFDTHNVMVGAYRELFQPLRADPDRMEEGYDWKAGVIGNPKYLQYSDQFARIYNSHARAELMARIDREVENDRIRAAAGWMGTITDIVAGGLDITTLLPGSIFYKGARGTFAIAKAALSTGSAAGVATGVQEALLHGQQATRTVEDSTLAVGTSIVLGGMLGGGLAGLLSRADRKAAEEAVERLAIAQANGASPPSPRMVPAAPNAGTSPTFSVGAATVQDVDWGLRSRDELTIAGRTAKFVGDWSASVRLSPNLRLNGSPSAVARQHAQELAENVSYQTMHEAGESLGPAVETLVRYKSAGRTNEAVHEVDRIFREMRDADGTLRRQEWNVAIGRAMANGDEALDGNPFVSRAAKAWRAKVYEPFKKEAIEAGLLAKDVDVDTAISYLNRLWNRDLLLAEGPQAREVFGSYFQQWARRMDRAMTFEAQRRIDAAEAAKNNWTSKREARRQNLLAEASEIEMAQLRRHENARRAAGGVTPAELAGQGVTPGDLATLVQMVRSGALKAPKVETLTGFVARNGGLVDESGELARMGITHRTRPGFARRKRRTSMDKHGGWSFDDMARHAWEDGFFPEHAERPSVREFLDALDGDFNGWRTVAREVDAEAAETARMVREIDDILARLGVSDVDKVRLAVPEDTAGLLAKVSKLLDEADAQRRAKIDQKIAEIEREIAGGDYIISTRARQAAIMRQHRDEVEAIFGNDAGDYKEFADQASRAVYDKLTGRGLDAEMAEIPDWIVPVARGPLKDRTFGIDDHLVERWLDRDISRAGVRYARTMAAEVEMTRRFGRADMRDQIAAVAADFDEMLDKVHAAKSAEEALEIVGREPSLLAGLRDWFTEARGKDVTAARKADIVDFLNARRARDIDDLKALRDLTRGTFNKDPDSTWSQLSRSLRAFNFIRSMGGVVLTSLGDVYRPVMVHGLRPYFEDVVGPFLARSQGIRLARDEVRLAGLAGDAAAASKLMTVAEIGDRYHGGSRIDRLAENLTKVASRWSGIVYFTDWTKSVAGIMVQARINRAILDGGDERLLAYLGIRPDMVPRLRDHLNSHGEEVDGVFVAHSERWVREVEDPDIARSILLRTGRYNGEGRMSVRDGEAIDAYRSAIAKDVDSVITSRGIGDLPLFANTPTGKLLLQFKTFNIAAHQRVLMRGLQENQARFVGGIVAMTTIGIAQSYLRAMYNSYAAGDGRWERYLADARNPGFLIGEGLDWSGLFTLFMDTSNTMEKTLKVNPVKDPLRAVFSDGRQAGTSQRFHNRDPISALAGPSAGLVSDAFTAAGAPIANISGETDATGAKSALRLLPFYSYPGARQFLQLLFGKHAP